MEIPGKYKLLEEVLLVEDKQIYKNYYCIIFLQVHRKIELYKLKGSNYGPSNQTTIHLFNTLIRTKLEYAPTVSLTIQNRYMDKMESLQRNFLSGIFKLDHTKTGRMKTYITSNNLNKKW